MKKILQVALSKWDSKAVNMSNKDCAYVITFKVESSWVSWLALLSLS